MAVNPTTHGIHAAYKDLETRHDILQGAMNRCEEHVQALLFTDKGKLQARVERLESAVRAALKISDLWRYGGEVPDEHRGEAQAIELMFNEFKGLKVNHE